MATLKCKGTLLKLTFASILTPVAQILGIEVSEVGNETFEADYLDNASPAILKQNTGRVDCGKISGELFFDPALASHVSYYGICIAPPTAPVAGAIVYANTPATTMSFTAVGFKLSHTVAMKDGLKGKFSFENATLPTFATAGS